MPLLPIGLPTQMRLRGKTPGGVIVLQCVVLLRLSSARLQIRADAAPRALLCHAVPVRQRQREKRAPTHSVVLRLYKPILALAPGVRRDTARSGHVLALPIPGPRLSN